MMKKLSFVMLNIVFSIFQLNAQTISCTDRLEPNNTKDKATPFSGSYYRVDEVCLTENDEDWFVFPYSKTQFHIKVKGGTPKVTGRYLFKVSINGGKASIETAPSPLANSQYTAPIDTYLELYSADGKLVSWNDDDVLYSSIGNKMAKIWNFDLNNYRNLVCPAPNSADITVTASETTADFSWKAIDGAASYTFDWRLESVATWTTQVIATPKVSLSGLTADTRYIFQIKCNCANGLPPLSSSTTTFTTKKKFVPIFTIEKRVVETIAKAGQPTVPVSSNVEWKLGNQVGNFFSLSIEKYTGGNGQDGKVIITTTENTTTADRKGSFEIQPQYAGLSAVKIDITQKGKVETTPATCAVPTTLTHQVSGSTLTASWGAVTGVSYYKIDMQLNGGAWGLWGTGQTTTNQFVSSGAQSGANVCYKVQAVCTNGVTSSVSNPYCFKLDGGPVATCGTPANLTHTLLTNDQATVSWDAISGATSYDIYSNYGTATYIFLQNVSTNSITRSVSPNLNVCFKVVAVCPNAVRSPQSSEYCFDSRLLVYPNTHTVSSAAGSLTVTVDAADKWTASPSLSGVKVSPSSGNAGKNQKVTITYPALSTVNKRLAAEVETFKVDFNSVSTVTKLNQAVKVYQNMTPDEKLSNKPYEFKIDNSRESRGVKIYYKNIGTESAEVIYVLDLQKGARLNFNLGKENGSTKTYLRQTAEEVFNQQKGNNPNLVAVTNGQFFGEKNPYSTISKPVKINGVFYGNTNLYLLQDGIKITPRFYQKLGISSDGRAAFIYDLFQTQEQINKEGDTYQIKNTDLTSTNGLVGFFINVEALMDAIDNWTLLGGIDIDKNPDNGYERVAIYVGRNTKHKAALILRELGVPYDGNGGSKKTDINISKILQLDGGGSTQVYGISGIYKKSSDNGFPVSIAFGRCYDYICYDHNRDGVSEDCYCLERKIPQTISILSASTSTREGVTDSTSTVVSDINQSLDTKEGITASPNPTKNGLVRLQLGGMNQEDEVEVGVFDEIGKQASSTLSGKVMEINGKEIQLPTTQTPKMFIIHALNKTTDKKYSDKVMVSGQ